MVDVIKQVAEARCPHDSFSVEEGSGAKCDVCGGRISEPQLRWPSLSRECSNHQLVVEEGSGARCNLCGNGIFAGNRIPDVTLEKVLEILRYVGKGVLLGGTVDGWFTGTSNENKETPLEAACTALMATVE